jgi:transcriptional regulator with XRE-family HTH domain
MSVIAHNQTGESRRTAVTVCHAADILTVKRSRMTKTSKSHRLEFGQRLQQLREDRSLTAAKLAKLTGVTPAAVWNWEKGTIPRSEALLSVAQALGVSIEYLKSGESSINGRLPKRQIESIDGGASMTDSGADLHDIRLEDLVKAIESRGFDVTLSSKQMSSL